VFGGGNGDWRRSNAVLKEVVLHFDGGIRNGQMSYGYWAVAPDQEEMLRSITKPGDWLPMVLFAHSGRSGKNGTSNVSEYRSLMYGLKRCVEEDVKIVHVQGDSQLIIKQITGAFRVNNEDLRTEHARILRVLSCFDKWTVKWIPRKQNKKADYLANLAFERGKKK